MSPPLSPPAPLPFGPFVLDTVQARLLRDGQEVPLRPKAYALLCALAARAGALVTKDELLDAVWGTRFVTEGVVKTAMAELRQALGDDPKAPAWIQTVPRRGYRFMAPAAPAAAPVSQADIATPTQAAPIGREPEIAQLQALLQAHPLITVTGPGGVGKTRLARACAASLQERFADGVRVLELAALPPDADASQVRAQLARLLQLSPEAAGSAARLAREAAGLRVLLVLDNAEHLAAAVASVVGELLEGAPAWRLLVTSQVALGLAGEQVCRLAPLAVPPAGDLPLPELLEHAAARMLVACIAARLPSFEPTPHQAGALSGICRLLDGLPLALELAAARVPVLGVNGLFERLKGDDAVTPPQHLALLSRGARDAPARQRSLRDTLAWSHALLSPAEQAVFRRLAVFRGGFTLALAEGVCGDASLDGLAVMDALGDLVDKSFLVAADAADPGGRLQLLESPRLFALELLEAAGEAPATRWRHAEALAALLDEAMATAQATPALQWLSQHAADSENLRAALRWARTAPGRLELASRLLYTGSRLWLRMGLVDECVRGLEALREPVRADGDLAARGRLAVVQALACLYGDEPPAHALAALDEAEPWLAQEATALDRYWALHLRYVVLLRADPARDREPVLKAMQALEQPSWNRLVTSMRRMDCAHEDYLHGRTEQHLAFARAQWAEHRASGAQLESWSLVQMLMPAEYLAGRLDVAVRIGAEAVAEMRAAGHLRTHRTGLVVWLQMLAEQGDNAAARRELGRVAPTMLLPGGQLWMVSLALLWLPWHEGRAETAARLLGWSDAALRRSESGAAGPYSQRSLERIGAHLAQALPAERLQALRAQGEALDDEAALAQALA